MISKLIKSIIKVILIGLLGFSAAFIILGYLIPSVLCGVVSAAVGAWWIWDKEKNDGSEEV